ncbi:Putative metallocarboxypeptidase ecm14 [Xanthoria parietina]
MRHLSNCCILTILLSIAVAAYTPGYASLSTFHQLQTPSRTRSVFSRLRDGLIRSVWSIPSCTGEGGASNDVKSASPPPSTLLARYGGDVVLRFSINSPEEAAALTEAVHVLFLDVWEFNADWVDIRLAKEVVPSLLGLLPPSLQHAHTPLMHDLAQAIFESYPSLTFEDPSPRPQDEHRPFSPVLQASPNTDQTNLFFRNYQPLSVIIPWMRLLRSLFPTHVRMINVGVSYEGRDIPALRVGVHPTNADKPSSPRKTIIIAGGSHAREWISTSTVNYVAYSFITAYGKSQEMTRLLEEFDWVFVPTINPDGYIYTWENDRLWRKNRQQTSLRFCQGVDLDHSYSFQWDHDSTVANNPCSESFAGEGPFQGVEARRFANWARNETANNNVSIVAFVDLHSYSQQILYPYSYSCATTPPALENLEEMGLGLAKAIRMTNGEEYSVTAACEGSVDSEENQEKKKKFWPRIESGGGSALDWFYHELNVKYSYQIKLRDTGSYGFLLPSKNIVPTGLETFNAIKYMGHFLLGKKGFEVEEEESREGSTAVAAGKHDEEFEDDAADVELRRRRRR